MEPLENLFRYAAQTKQPPEKLAAAIKLWRQDALAEGRELSKGDNEKYWRGNQGVDTDAAEAIAGARHLDQLQSISPFFSDPDEQQKFIDTLAKDKVLPAEAPESWHNAESELQRVAQKPEYQTGVVFNSRIKVGAADLGGFEVRTFDPEQEEADVYVRPAKGKPILTKISLDRPKEVEAAQKEVEATKSQFQKEYQPYLKSRYEDYYGKGSAKDKSFDELATELTTLEEETARSDQPVTLDPTVAKVFGDSSGYTKARDRLEFLTTASDQAFLQDQTIRSLKTNEEFLKTVPQNSIEQYTTRPFVKAAGSLIEAGKGAIDALTGNRDSGQFFRDIESAEERLAPGRLESRFTSEDTPVGDMVEQGIESALLLTPGGLAAKGAARTVTGFGSFMTSAYGNTYANSIKLADELKTTDPERAARIRNNAQFTALTSAALEGLVEKLPGPNIESALLKGKGLSYLGILGQAPREYAEEFIQANAENVLSREFNTGEDMQDPFKAGEGGFYGALPLAGAGVLGRAAGAFRQPEGTIERIEGQPSIPKSDIGGTVLGNVPANTPIEEIEAVTNEIVDNLTEGERRLQELTALDRPAPVAETLPAGQVSSPEDAGAKGPSELPASETAPDTSILREGPLTEETQRTDEEVSGPAEEPSLLEDEQETPAAAPTPTDVQVIEEINRIKGSGLSLIEKPKGRLVRFAEQIASISGRKVLYVRGDSRFDGAQFGNYLVVKPNGRQAIRKLVGHELGHSLEGVKGFETVLDALRKRDAAGFEAYSDKLKSFGYEDNEIESEFFADTIAEAIADRRFWRSLQQETDPTLLQNITDSLLNVLDKISEFWTQVSTESSARPVASKTLKNVETARVAIRELIKTRGTPQAGPVREASPESRSKPRLMGIPETPEEAEKPKTSQQNYENALRVLQPNAPARFVRDDTPPFDDEVLVTKSTKEPGKWQATLLRREDYGEPKTPAGDARYDTWDQAVRSATGMPVPGNSSPGAGSFAFEAVPNIRESRVLPTAEDRMAQTQEYGVFTSQHAVTTMRSLHAVADKILPVQKITADSYDQARDALKGIFRANGATRTQIERGVEKEFSDRLNNLTKKDRDTELNILKSMTVRAVAANVMNIALNFRARKGPRNRMRAAQLTLLVRRLGKQDIFQVGDNPHTAARILRATQLERPEGGSLVDLIQNLFESASQWAAEKAGASPEALDLIEQGTERARPDALRALSARVRDTVRTTQPGGEEYFTAQTRQKGKVRTFGEKLIKWITGRESRTVTPEESALMEALTRLEQDYEGNIDLFEELARDVIERLPADRQAAALKELNQLVEFDIELAEKANNLFDENRNMNRVVKSFITKTLYPKPKKTLQAAADLAAWRLAVREGKATPAEVADAFVQEGGDRTLRADFETALEEDTSKKIQQETLRDEAKKAKKEYRDWLKEEGRKAAQEEDFQKRVEMAGTKAAIEASRELIRDTGEEVAMGEDFQKQLEDQAAQVVVEESQELIKEVGGEIARQEAFQKRLEEEARKASRQLSKELVKEVGAAEAKAEDFQKALKKQADEFDRQEEAFAKRALTSGRAPKGRERKTTLEEDFIQTIEENPEWDVTDEAGKIEIIKEILRRRGVADHLIDKTARESVKAFNDRLVAAAQKAAAVLIKQMQKGKISIEQLYRAIRLQILNPTKDLSETLAAMTGWKGLTEAEFDKIYDAAQKALGVSEPQAKLAMWQEINRVILASGVSPAFKDTISSSVRASMFGGTSSLALQGLASLNSFLYIPVRHALERLVKNPLQAVNILHETIAKLGKNIRPAFQSGKLAFFRHANISMPTSQESYGHVGVLAVESLVRQMDQAKKRLQDPKSSNKTKVLAALDYFYSGLRGFVWRVYGFWDSFNITLQKRFLSEVTLNAALRKQGISPKEAYSAFSETVDRATEYAVKQLGLPEDIARIEARHRVELAWYEYLRGQTKGTVRPEVIDQDAFREAIHQMGNHAEVQGLLSEAANKFVAFSEKLPAGVGPAMFGPTRIPTNVAEASAWWLPGYNIFRLLREYQNQKKGKAIGKFSGRFHLAALTPFQFARRRNEVIYSNILYAALIAVFMNQDDDDPDNLFHYDGAAPTNPAERNQFFTEGRTEYTAYYGKRTERQVKLQLTRGVFEFLNFPILAAKYTADVLKGKNSAAVAAGRMAYDIANIGLPPVTNSIKSAEIFREGDDARIKAHIADKLSSFIPLSALSRSVIRATDVPQSRDDADYLLGRLIPATVLFTRDGRLEMRNFLDENPLAEDDAFNMMARLGIPLTLFSRRGTQDPELKGDFQAMNYFPAPVETLKEFKKSYAGREADVFKTNDVENDQELFDKFRKQRAANFKEIYKEYEPNANSKDQRSTEEIVEAGDKEAFKKRMATIRGQSTKKTKEDMKITIEEE